MDLNLLLRNANEIVLDRKSCSLTFRFKADDHWSEFMELFRIQSGNLSYVYSVNSYMELTVIISIHQWLLATAHSIGVNLASQKHVNSYIYVALQKEKEKQAYSPPHSGV